MSQNPWEIDCYDDGDEYKIEAAWDAMKPEDFYFRMDPDCDDEVASVAITPKKYHDTEGCLFDGGGYPSFFTKPPLNLFETMESFFEAECSREELRQRLLDAGFIEKPDMHF